MNLRPVIRLARILLPLAATHLQAHPETAEARAEFDRLIAEFPNEPELRLRRAEHRIENREFDAAETDLRHARVLAPREPRILIAYASLALARNQPEVARQRLAVALSLAPRDPGALILRARASAQLGDAASAHADYSDAIAALPEPSPDLFLARAALPIAPELALRGLDEGLARLGPAPPLVERAITLELSLGRTDAALARLAALAAKAERKETFLKRRGEILASAGRTTEAREAFRLALAAIASLPAWLRESPATVQLTTELNRLLSSQP